MIGADNNKYFIIAEISANHRGDINVAKQTIRAAKTVWTRCSKTSNIYGRFNYIDCKKRVFQK